jgi:hypothetical protein
MISESPMKPKTDGKAVNFPYGWQIHVMHDSHLFLDHSKCRDSCTKIQKGSTDGNCATPGKFVFLEIRSFIIALSQIISLPNSIW